MKKTGRCPKCESDKILMNAMVADRMGHPDGSTDLSVSIYRDPDALFFTGEERFPLRAWVCSECGYTEFYTENAREAYNIAKGEE